MKATILYHADQVIICLKEKQFVNYSMCYVVIMKRFGRNIHDNCTFFIRKEPSTVSGVIHAIYDRTTYKFLNLLDWINYIRVLFIKRTENERKNAFDFYINRLELCTKEEPDSIENMSWFICMCRRPQYFLWDKPFTIIQ